MMYLITGQPGNGKSLRAMWQALQEYERNQAAVKAGKEQPRRFFTNIAGATTEENSQAFAWMERLPAHNDWTQLPDGSYVIYDEAHADGKTKELERYGTLFPGTGKPGESDDPRVRAMSTHRHRGFDLVFVTQWPSKIHHQIRSLIGEHVHMTRAMGLGCAGVMKWTRVQVDPYDEKQREKAEEEIWRFEKSLYERYKSSSLHTASHKFRIPAKVWQGLSTLVVTGLVIWGIYVFVMSRTSAGGRPEPSGGALAPAAQALFSNSSASQEPEEVFVRPGIGTNASIATAPVPTLGGCVSSDRGCRCFNTEGFQIDMTQQECKKTLEGPLPFNVYHEYRPPAGQLVQQARADEKAQEPSSAGMVFPKARNGAQTFPESPGYECETCTTVTTSGG